ncbi:MAG: hypothetical protein FJX56_00225 [Alphaproteobacteria bacterium]|nr:hypothetical protein [Alphaproteobacteria bacterium]
MSPWPTKRYRDELTKYGLDMRIAQDVTDEFCEMVTSAWWQCQNEIRALKQAGRVDHAFLWAMAAEGDLWLHRTNAVKSGALRLCRFHALKPTTAR